MLRNVRNIYSKGWTFKLIYYFLGAIPDAKLYLAESLGKLSTAHPGRLGPLISSGLAPEAQAFLTKYLQAANAQII